MSLPKKHLYNDEEVVLDMHPHWWYLVPRGAILGLSIVLALWFFIEKPGRADNGDGYVWWGNGLRWGAIILLVVGLLVFLFRLIEWNYINFVVTTERCIYRSGVFAKTGIEIPLDRINTVFFNQGVFERLVRAGDLAIESAGENSRQSFSDIYDPLNVQNVIYKEMEANEDRKTEKLRGAIHNTGGAQPTAADEIAKLHELRQSGAITEDEYQAQKNRLLGS